MRRLLILNYIYLSIALYGCSAQNHPTEFIYTEDMIDKYGLNLKPSTNMKVSFEEMSVYYEQTMACMGMTAPGPIVYFKSFKEYFNGGVGAVWGFHTQGTIYVNTDENIPAGIERNEYTDVETLKHEYIHNILYHTTGDGDAQHSSEMYELCGMGPAVNN